MVSSTASVATRIDAGPHWSSRLCFTMAVTGCAVGLGDLGGFPRLVSEHGGGPFILIYLGCLFGLGVPILVAALSLGRLGGPDPVGALSIAAGGRAGAWRWAGWFMTLTAFLLLSLSGVFAGGALEQAWSGATAGLAVAGDQAVRILPGHALAVSMTAVIVAAGIRGGIELAMRLMMPALFAMLGALVLYAAATSPNFGQALRLVFVGDFSRLTAEGLLAAAGHALLTLGVGAGAMVSYGAYAGHHVPVARVAITVALLDTIAAMLGVLALLPITLDAGHDPAGGLEFLFGGLPRAFAMLSGGGTVGTVFFTLVALAALTSAIALLESLVNTACRALGTTRAASVAIVTAAAWATGLIVSSWPAVPGVSQVVDASLRVALVNFMSGLLLPFGALTIAIVVGWAVAPRQAAQAAGLAGSRWCGPWLFALRFGVPAAIVVVVLYAQGVTVTGLP